MCSGSPRSVLNVLKANGGVYRGRLRALADFLGTTMPVVAIELVCLLQQKKIYVIPDETLEPGLIVIERATIHLAAGSPRAAAPRIH